MFICLNCELEFSEQEAILVEYGTGAVSSKVQEYGCPCCKSTIIKEIETGKIQGS